MYKYDYTNIIDITNFRVAYGLICIVFLLFTGFKLNHGAIHSHSQKMAGITVVAPPAPFHLNPFEEILTINARWIAIIPYAFTRPGEGEVRYNHRRQWWGETPEGIRESILKAKENGFRIMLKPQVYIPGSWVGDMNFTSEDDWHLWESTYEKYIMDMVCIAMELDVELFCIGTEYKWAATKREAFWRRLVTNIRDVYDGTLTYSANWDQYNQIPFWDALDFIGISAYFPLTEEVNPTPDLLKKKWKPIVRTLKKFSEKNRKKILFTEYGYLSVDGCAGSSWLLEKNIRNLSVNEEAQATAYKALLSTFHAEDFWAGGFLWKWFPSMKGHEGYPERDYTPQGKMAEEVIREMYGAF
ncbi:MAG TPA: hypothetical protein PKC30_02730 [Saprospiraceae bacterium]|nr:hypothetical protein [Saprospiraceae bacterium]